MKKNAYIFLLLFAAALLLPSLAPAQENQLSKWIRVQSDNAEFSVEFPAAHVFYVDRDGFSIADSSRSYSLTEIRTLNAYHEKALLSLEVYKTNAPKAAADIFVERDERNGTETEIKAGKLKFRQVLIEKETHYAVRRFYASETHLYVLTAASRNGETSALKRLLDSVAFKTPKAEIEPAQASEAAAVKVVSFSALKVSPLAIEQNLEPSKKLGDTKTSPKPADNENSLPLVIVIKPPASYTEAARETGENGTIRVRLTFSENGSVTKISFLSALKGGLMRQVVFAAISLKFLPKEENGEPVASVRIVDYSFSIY